MAHTAKLAGESDILKSNTDLSFSYAPYRYSIQTANGISSYSIANGLRQRAEPLVWAS